MLADSEKITKYRCQLLVLCFQCFCSRRLTDFLSKGLTVVFVISSDCFFGFLPSGVRYLLRLVVELSVFVRKSEFEKLEFYDMVHHEFPVVTLGLVFGLRNVVNTLFSANFVFDLCIIVIPLIPFDIVLIYVDGLWWVTYMILVRQSFDYLPGLPCARESSGESVTKES